MTVRRAFAALKPAALLLLLLASACDTATGPSKKGIFDMPTGPSDPSAGGGAKTLCLHILQCFQGCKDDKACDQACYDSATPKARSAYDELVDCGEQNGCEDGACLRASCPDEVAVCEGRSGG